MNDMIKNEEIDDLNIINEFNFKGSYATFANILALLSLAFIVFLFSKNFLISPITTDNIFSKEIIQIFIVFLIFFCYSLWLFYKIFIF